MQAERVQVLAQQAAAGNAEAFLSLVQEFAPELRLALAAHLDQPGALMTVEPAVWTAIRSRLGEFIGDPPFASWIQHVAVEVVTAHLAQADRRAIDHQDALSHQIIEQCREALADGSELQVALIRSRIAALPDAMRTLVQRRYRDRQRSADIAASLMISEAELATSLAAARAACDWRGLAQPPAAGDRLVPPLIEDWLNNTIDVDSRALLATNLGRDLERAAQFARQVRVHLALGACLTPFTRDDAAALMRQTGLGAGDSARVMMGEGPRPSSAARSTTSGSSESRRPARLTTSNRQVVPLVEESPRSSPLPWIIGGGMVLAGIGALVLLSLGGPGRTPTARPTESPQPVGVTSPPPVSPAPVPLSPGSGSVLRPEQGRGMTTVPLPRVELTGAVVTGRAYTGHPLDLRVALSHDLGVTAVEYWNGTERLASVTAAPWAWTWAVLPSGTASITAKVIAGKESTTSAAKPLTIVPALGTGSIRREWWTGIGGELLTQGYTVAGYPDRPPGSTEERIFSAPRNWGDAYLQRMRAWVVPPLDGEYTFWLAADDEAELWLSDDDTRARLHRICWSPMIPGGGIFPEEWERDAKHQRSPPIRLERGKRYYIEALHKEGGGDDHLEVGWRLPDGMLERPIPGAHFIPADDVVPPLPVIAAPTPAPVPPPVNAATGDAATVLVLWNGEDKAGGSGYASSGITKVPGSGRSGGMGLQANLGGDFVNLGWNWCGWFPDDGGDDVRAGNALSFWIRLDGARLPRDVDIQFLSGPKQVQARSASIDVDTLVPQLADGAWHQVVIPFERLTAPGFDLAKLWEFNLKLGGVGAMQGTVSLDDVTVVRQAAIATTAATPTPTSTPTPTPPAPPAAPAPAPWKVVRAINLGGEAAEIDGVKFQSHRLAEAEGASPAGSHRPGPWLSDLNWVRGSTGTGDIKRDATMSGPPMKIDGKAYAKGLGVHANSELVYAIDGRYSGFTAVVGVDDVAPGGEVIFQVWLDGQKAWDSGVVRKGTAKPVALPLAGRKELRLVVDSNGPGDWDHADWGNAQFLEPGGDDGALQVQTGRRSTATYTPKPAVDTKARTLLTTALVGSKEGLAFRVKVPNGPHRVWLWLGENGTTNSRQFDLTVEGTTLPGIGLLAAGAWEKIGPIDVTVSDGTIDVATTVLKGIPQMMGILVEQPTVPTPAPAPTP